MEITILDFANNDHEKAFVKLLNAYMLDDMGLNKPLEPEHAEKVIFDIKQHVSYIGFLVEDENGSFLALANCFVNYSTFAAKPLINIHDLIVHPDARKMGVGQALLRGIEKYAHQNGYCRVNLEVRNDNHKALALYKKAGFRECQPPMYFWEKKV
ncbi:GNAT family N-acetyltransferase [Marinilabilia rubra]|uniref:GNAT family N-acetyltransferase n=1 Tax=Marinilabilia rubra TaxID=2162893 RepID=A0A2U2BBY7_9BACT|nr:GNAT family N-acetyltransferase [Marinilabilia rubra]PWE00571.1 GNAT family N-acetyltransferase [Marinilabilia rubra]